ncbi:MAG: hypothetical protein HKN16_05960 [Saprospiraceae bacterium]|nr:hypothetical protein [Saprospiraceae bacterium]
MLKLRLVFFLAILSGLMACKKDSSVATIEDEPIVEETFPEDVFTVPDSTGALILTESQLALKRHLGDPNQNAQVATLITAEDLISLYPTSMGDLSLFDQGGEISESLGQPATLTRTIYRKGNNVARVNLIDTGGHPGSLLATAHWGPRGIHREAENLLEQTRTFRGFPAFQRWLPKLQQSNFEYVIDNRFVVSIQGKNIDMAQVEEIAKFLSPAKIRRLAKK